ncbi:LOW QUALITY PROTEIN: interleukin-1 receptor-like 1 [Cebidichthys violaceus]|uniref:LOW QUALITY PROTEIN: interleukin-1 receptor-like 1 n=1 Tax=Cebidichthys violaceus TaxID=271503 RepID=UPI0035CCA13F
MAATGWILLLTALMSAASTVAHTDHSGAADTYHVSVGHLFLLKCLFADAHAHVTWSRGGARGPRLPAGVEVRDGLLWFLPVQMSHDGTYTCEKRYSGALPLNSRSGSSNVTFGVSVSRGKCPDPPENKSITLGVSEGISCKQTEIFKLNTTRNVRWMKDCRPMDHISVEQSGLMRMSAASQKDAGMYTCLVDVSVDGRTYTAARSIRLTVKNITVIPEPEVVYPQQEVVVVEEGMSATLECLAYIGYSEDSEALMYWTVDKNDSDDLEELEDSWNFKHDRGQVYGQSNLSISKVRRHFLNVPISCFVSNSAGRKAGIVWLREVRLLLSPADHSALYTGVALCLSASLAVLLLAAAVLVFKVDLVLAHRTLLKHFSKQDPDGKLYDAYVSFLPPDALSSAEMASLALQILPEKLETQHGYSLYIRGRDDCPGEAMHDVIAATVRKCRRLIIILSPGVKSTKTEEEVPLRDNVNQLCYEQKVGLYDALTQNEPRVILVEIDGPVDYSCLPESLRYIRRKQGALTWKKTYLRTNRLNRLRSNRNFWKNLRYHMPPVPAGDSRPPSEPRDKFRRLQISVPRETLFIYLTCGNQTASLKHI